MTITMETPVDSSLVEYESSLLEGTGGYIVPEQGALRRILARVVDVVTTRKPSDEYIAYFRTGMFTMAVRGGTGQAGVTLLTEKPKSKPRSGTDSSSLVADLPTLTKKGEPPVFAAGIPKNTEALHLNLDSQSEETVILGPVAGESDPATPPDLAEALHEVDRAEAIAREDDIPIPPPDMLKDIRTLLRQMYDIHPYRYDVYPSSRGEMVIYARPELGRSIMVVRHADGTAWCSVCVPERNSAISYKSEDFVSAETLREALGVMNSRGGA